LRLNFNPTQPKIISLKNTIDRNCYVPLSHRRSSKGLENLQQFIITAFTSKMPALIRFTLQSRAATELAKRIMLSNSGSKATLYQYMYGVYRFCTYLGKTPDNLISECLGTNDEPLLKIINSHSKLLDEFVLELRASGLAPGTINNHVKGVKELYRTNNIKLELPYKLSRRVVYNDRAPTQNELLRILEIADLRGKIIVSMLALGGFRVGTLCKLKYQHIRKDFESKIRPIHIHVEANITKGKYGEYDAFIGEEAASYLELYLNERMNGKIYGIGGPENINDDSPLIRDEHSLKVRPLTPWRHT
jgi:integrase